MVSSGLLRRLALVRTDVSEESGVSVSRLLVAACGVPSSPIFVTHSKEAPGSSETSILTRVTRLNNPEDTVLYYCSIVVGMEKIFQYFLYISMLIFPVDSKWS
jgi:hypothetical protein